MPIPTTTITDEIEYTSFIDNNNSIDIFNISTTSKELLDTFSNFDIMNEDNQYSCWSQSIGYSCCNPEITEVYMSDEYGEWGYDFNKNEWCGIIPIFKTASNDEVCWSEKFGYSCCHSCDVYAIDSNGLWGFESNNWCGIPSHC